MKKEIERMLSLVEREDDDEGQETHGKSLYDC